MIKTILIIFLSLSISRVNGQDASLDSSGRNETTLSYRSLVIPTVLIGYGVAGLTIPALKKLNTSLNSELIGQHYGRVRIDDYTQYTPALSVYALNGLGIQGKNNFRDRTIVMTTAYIIMWSSVSLLKNTSGVERPDGSNTKSFPSGHTANAFLGAEFLYQEYKDVSVWYGISGYVVATGTGFLRMTNNKHWLSDVAAGAGIGILSTKIAYWVHPFFQRTIFKDNNTLNGLALPFYNGKHYGLGLTMTF